jgi:hypothetical protein
MSNYRTYRFLPNSSKNIWLKEAVDQRKLTKKSATNDNVGIMHYDICYSTIEPL